MEAVLHLYREYPPHPALAGHVACLWTSHALPGPVPLTTRILPDNCIDILWQDSASLGKVAGMMSRPHHVAVVVPVRTVAVRFRPGAARAFLDVPLATLQDGHPVLADLWPRHAGPHAQRATIERALLARLRGHAAPSADRLARAAVALVEADGGAARIDDVAGALGVTRQYLALLFRERVGLPAKTFAQVCRFRRAHAALRATARPAGPVDWAALAGDCGYYDQSHLIHAFRQFADASPQAFLRNGEARP